MADHLMQLAKHTSGKVAVFIDAANILYSQRSMGWEVDYKKLSRFLRENFDIRYLGFYYTSDIGNKAQSKFINILSNSKYTIVTKPTKFIKSGSLITQVKGNMDIELTLDLVTKLDQYDTCYLFSGDSDFDVLIWYLKANNKRVVVFSTRGHISRELASSSDKYFDLLKFKGILARKNHPPIARGGGPFKNNIS